MRGLLNLFLSALFILWVDCAFSQSTETVLQGELRSFTAQGGGGWSYNWRLQKPDGTITTLSSTTTEIEEIVFTSEGAYILSVQATDGNGCLTERIYKTITVDGYVSLAANDDNFQTSLETPVNINILANDEGVLASTRISFSSETENGGILVSENDGTVTYTPPDNFWGNDSFSYQLCTADNSGCSEAVVTINIVNEALENIKALAVTDINLTWQNSPVSGNVLTNDLFYEDGVAEVGVVTIPAATTGRLTNFNTTTGEYTFEPAAGFTGEAVFEYKLCQQNGSGGEDCSATFVTIQVLAGDEENQLPVANDDVVTAVQGSLVQGNFLLNDFDPRSESFSISAVVTSDLAGTLSWNADGSFTVTPTAGFTGETHFNYQICTPAGNCDWATVSIQVIPSDVLSLYANDDVFYSEGVITGNLAQNDDNWSGASLIYNVNPVFGPAHGSVQINTDGTFTFTSAQGENGQLSDQFVYEVCTSGSENCSQATAYIAGNIPEIFVVVNSNVTTGECLPVTLDASASVGAGTLSYNWSPVDYLDDPTSSKPVFTAGESTDYVVTVTDQFGNSAQKTVHVTVNPLPQIVVAGEVYIQSASEEIMLDASASTGTNLVFNWWSDNGGVIVSNDETATPTVKGIGKYYVEATDTYGCQALDSVIVGLYVQVVAVNDTAHVFVNNSVNINVLANDRPTGELDLATISILSPPDNGVAYVSSDSIITYTPDQYFVGNDNFVYTICNYLNECDDANVLVIVSDGELFIPTAFSPNGDGINDYFEIKGLGNYKQASIKIFNRWGNVVYESGNYGAGSGKSGFWNGIANKGVRVGNSQVATGTYFYTLDLGSGEQKLSGYIYIDR